MPDDDPSMSLYDTVDWSGDFDDDMDGIDDLLDTEVSGDDF
jgi:hypothetical protein